MKARVKGLQLRNPTSWAKKAALRQSSLMNTNGVTGSLLMEGILQCDIATMSLLDIDRGEVPNAAR